MTLDKRNRIDFKTIVLHIGGWSLFIILPSLLQMGKSINFNLIFQSNHEFQNLMSWVLLVIYSYLNYLIFVPRYYLNKDYLRYILIVFASLVLIYSVPEILDLFWISPPPDTAHFGTVDGTIPAPPPVDGNRHFQFVLLFGLSTIMSMVTLLKDKLRDIENIKIQSELLNLKSQIQPHFLFNTLNSIYALALRNHEQTAENVLKLSKFLRYVINEADNNEVKLIKEIEYIIDYIDLQKSRHRDALEVDFEYDLESESVEIAPLLIFSFIENAFQYGVNPNKQSKITISIESTNEYVILKVNNKKVNETRTDGTGIGITNSKKRMELLYPDKHSLDIINDTEDFFVTLKIEVC